MTQKPGQILHGHAGNVLCGQGGSILFADTLPYRKIRIVVEWGEMDLDVCGYYAFPPTADADGLRVGWDWKEQVDDASNGLYQRWDSNDNRTGGPEVVIIGFLSDANQASPLIYRMHANWWEGEGPATVTARDSYGNSRSWTLEPGRNRHVAAKPTDPFIDIQIRPNGELVL